ncbi:MAG: class I SAM-dependent DNA methyltransferase [Acidimicrobiales bacterium]
MRTVPAFDGNEYQARFDDLAQRGVDVNGEADLVRSLHPHSALDAGCGTGRVAVELARHGIEVVGVDIDGSMLSVARTRAPDLDWVQADLSALELGRRFDVVVLAGNVPIFCPEQARPDLIASCAAHVSPGGFLVAGFQLDRGYALDDWDRGCREAGLVLVERWSTWDRAPFGPGDAYAVSLHRHDGRPGPARRGGVAPRS